MIQNGSYVPPTCDITYLYQAKDCSDLGHVTRREIRPVISLKECNLIGQNSLSMV